MKAKELEILKSKLTFQLDKAKKHAPLVELEDDDTKPNVDRVRDTAAQMREFKDSDIIEWVSEKTPSMVTIDSKYASLYPFLIEQAFKCLDPDRPFYTFRDRFAIEGSITHELQHLAKAQGLRAELGVDFFKTDIGFGERLHFSPTVLFWGRCTYRQFKEIVEAPGDKSTADREILRIIKS